MKTILLSSLSVGVAAVLISPFIRIVLLCIVCFGIILYLGLRAVDEPAPASETEEE